MLETFYRENYHIVYGYLLSLCGDPSLAEELTAETFFRAVERIGRYDAQYKPSTWLCTIGRNLFLNYCRKKRRMTTLDAAENMVAPSAEALYMKKEQLEEIWSLLQRCRPEQRQLFIMRLEGMPFAEIASALGKSESWARVTYFRLKSQILREMEGKL